MQFGLSGTTRQLLLLVDALILATVLFFVIRLFNTKRGIQYLGFTFLAVLALIVTAYITLPGLHFFAQVLLVVLVVGLPLTYINQKSNNSSSAASPILGNDKFLHPALIVVLAIFGSLLFVGAASGFPGRISELPQSVSVKALNLSTGTSANFGSQKRVSVLVSAPSSAWQNLTSDSFSASVDLGGRGQGTYELPVNVSTTLSNVKIIRVNPANVTVTIEPVIRKTVTIVAKFNGKAGNDLVPDEPVFTPDKVDAVGPKSLIDDLVNAVVQVKLTDQTQTISQQLTPVALDNTGDTIEDISFDPAQVNVSVPLVKAGKLKTVGIVPKLTGQPAIGYWVEQAVADPDVVTVTGQIDQLDSLSSVDTNPISVSGLSADSTQTVALSLPSGITIADSTTKIAVHLTVAPTEATKAINPEIDYDGLDSSLKVTVLNPNQVSAMISGSSTTLSGISGSDIKLKLPLSTYKSAGTYSVSINTSNFVLPNGVGLVSFLPSAIDVTLESK